jgi:hypothetical protein
MERTKNSEDISKTLEMTLFSDVPDPLVVPMPVTLSNYIVEA